MRVSRFSTLVLWSMFGLATSSGCSKALDYPREPFSGTVTFNGSPVKSGHIVFEPRNGQATQTGGMIIDGKFQVPREGGGMPGSYSVAVFADPDADLPAGVDPGTAEADAAARKAARTAIVIPRRYNIDSVLTAELTAGQPNVFTFDLTSKSK